MVNRMVGAGVRRKANGEHGAKAKMNQGSFGDAHARDDIVTAHLWQRSLAVTMRRWAQWRARSLL
jgi:hypothetical protein